ncbi:S-methyl-5'-thioadenosine phosphorylase [Rhodoferax sp.]|uniref:S-methyl-5'-thioadenosine phosphorylase n=1 Tax=Rhodoferax sp. TaxID=50421 RepID=UPI0026107905|nr:S-methyl-5'-thioadenosine phosphorylase [Rhodoferax sp.]MDD2926971.1 S-methyl-5'-thioadenosine phosphorylase [Rhodoferax sp.]
MPHAIVGVIGGSGLYQMDGLQNVYEHEVQTPFGAPSDVIVCGTLEGTPVAFLARHARGHKLIPSEVPYRANLYALKQLGVRYVLSLSAVGSLREELHPLDMVLPDQFIDLTRHRNSTFFGSGAVAHVSMAQPVCPLLQRILARAVQATDANIHLHQNGTYACIEGPQFSGRAESLWLRSMGADLVGMTNMPEAKLALEAQMAYATLAMVTDFDCWHPREAHVTTSMALENLLKNASRAQQITAHAIRFLRHDMPVSAAHTALQNALVTAPDDMPAATRQVLELLWS